MTVHTPAATVTRASSRTVRQAARSIDPPPGSGQQQRTVGGGAGLAPANGSVPRDSPVPRRMHPTPLSLRDPRPPAGRQYGVRTSIMNGPESSGGPPLVSLLLLLLLRGNGEW